MRLFRRHPKNRSCKRTEEVLANYKRRAENAERKLALLTAEPVIHKAEQAYFEAEIEGDWRNPMFHAVKAVAQEIERMVR